MYLTEKNEAGLKQEEMSDVTLNIVSTQHVQEDTLFTV